MLRSVLQDNVSPALESAIGDVQLPIDFAEERSLVGVDLTDPKARHFAPRFRGIIAVLKVL